MRIKIWFIYTNIVSYDFFHLSVMKGSVLLFADEFCDKFIVNSAIVYTQITRINRGEHKWYNIHKRTKCYEAK